VPGAVMRPGLPRKDAPMTVQVTPLGSPVALNGMVWLTPMAEAGGVRVRAMALAVPVTLMTWGEVEALSVSVRVSARWPEAVGTKVTEREHVALGLTAAVQVLELVKSPGLLPAAATEEMVRAAVPVLVTVTVMGALVAP